MKVCIDRNTDGQVTPEINGIMVQYQTWCFVWMSIISQVQLCPSIECIYRIKQLPPVSILNRNGKSLPSKAISMQIKPPDDLLNGCIVNTTNFINMFSFDYEKEAVAVFSFQCFKVHPIDLMEYEGEHLDYVFGYLQVRYCTLGHNDVEQIFKAVNILVFTMLDSIFNSTKPICLNNTGNASECSKLDQMSSLAFTPSSNSPFNVIEVFKCSNSTFKTYELSISYQGWTEFPSFLQCKFPNLQTLELERNNLTKPPNFPWTKDIGHLGFNLSRSIYFDHHYESPFHIDIPDNIFRRFLNLNYNNITDLRNFSFSGRIDMISLKQNSLKYINKFTFINTTGLQSLDLSDNMIQNIPLGSFNGLSNLRNLNLRNNTINKLHSTIFHELQRIKKLDLSMNKLDFLPPYLFTRLQHLEILNLEFNLLTIIPTSSFPVPNVNLQEVRLNSNPLQEFPPVVFYLRYLKVAELKHTQISFDNITNLLANISFSYLGESVVDSAASNNINLEQSNLQKTTRIIDMTGSKVSRIGFRSQVNETALDSYLELILLNFKFILTDNEFKCDCKIIPFSNWIASKIRKNIFSGKEYFFNDWKCHKPIELRNRPVLSIAEEETYCEVTIEFCPRECRCYVWSISNITIVDCRNGDLSEVPDKLPDGTLDLWFQNNSISVLQTKEYLARSRDILLSHNTINDVSDDAINSMSNGLRKLHLDSNYLTFLPRLIQSFDDTQFLLKDNPFLCDCKTLWVKKWILQYQNLISDWTDITCSYGNEEAEQLILVGDEKFVCLEAFDTVKHVIAPSISSSICVLFIIVALATGFVFRLELKVLIFIYCGFHPFDKDEMDGNEDIDCLVIHSKLITEWVLKNIVVPLEADDKNYIICEISRDFVVGFSYQENICAIVKRSKRMILILSEEFILDSDIVKIAWNEAQEKIRDMRTNYAIVICHEISLKMIDNKDLKRYIKRGRYISTDDKLFFEKIIYCMPPSAEIKNKMLPNLRQIVLEAYENNIDTETEDIHAFLTYSDRDMHIALKTLTPALQEVNFVLHVPDRDFIPGASKEENILKAIGGCRHTIFLLSGPYLEDEWALFTFRTSNEKSIRQKCNHLIIILLDNMEEIMDEEIKHYLKTHVTLHIHDKWFWQKLIKALPGIRVNHHRENNLNLANNLNQNQPIRNGDKVTNEHIDVDALPNNNNLNNINDIKESRIIDTKI